MLNIIFSFFFFVFFCGFLFWTGVNDLLPVHKQRLSRVVDGRAVTSTTAAATARLSPPCLGGSGFYASSAVEVVFISTATPGNSLLIVGRGGGQGGRTGREDGELHLRQCCTSGAHVSTLFLPHYTIPTATHTHVRPCHHFWICMIYSLSCDTHHGQRTTFSFSFININHLTTLFVYVMFASTDGCSSPRRIKKWRYISRFCKKKTDFGL